MKPFIIIMTLILLSQSAYANAKKGKGDYRDNCQQCHGSSIDHSSNV
jgi:hypothetical protein